MTPTRFFLLIFILALAVTALMAIAIILIGKPSEFELKILLSTISIGVYSLVALCCATAYGNPDLHLLALFGIAACAVGLAFALLTNWQILKPEIASLLRLRVAFLSVPMALAGTTLMMRVSAASDIVKISRAATIFMIWATTSLLNLLMFSLGSGLQDKAFSLKLLAVTSILGLLGVIATPILKKVFPS